MASGTDAHLYSWKNFWIISVWNWKCNVLYITKLVENCQMADTLVLFLQTFSHTVHRKILIRVNSSHCIIINANYGHLFDSAFLATHSSHVITCILLKMQTSLLSDRLGTTSIFLHKTATSAFFNLQFIIFWQSFSVRTDSSYCICIKLIQQME